MIDQLYIGNMASYDDFHATVKERIDHKPKKKSIKETVPFSNVTYDFSAINGEIYWEEKTIDYVFEIIAMTPELLEEKKTAFSAWVMNVMNEDLHDPFLLDYHFQGTFSDISFQDEVEKTTATVTFTAYPYMISNAKRVFQYTLAAEEEITARILNNSSHRITPTFVCDVPVTVSKENHTISISAGETALDSFKLPVGASDLKIQASTAGILKIEFYEEVF